MALSATIASLLLRLPLSMQWRVSALYNVFAVPLRRQQRRQLTVGAYLVAHR